MEKQKRDLMLKESQTKKKSDFRKEMVSESEYLDKLKAEIEREKIDQIEKRRKEMHDA